MLGIIFAMKEEGDLFNSHLSIKEKKIVATLEFIIGSFDTKDMVTVISGIGKVNAAMATQLLISEFNVNKILLVGLAGSLNSDLNKGDIVLGINYDYNDFDLTPLGYNYGEIPNVSKFSPDAILLSQFTSVLKQHSDIHYMLGTIVTGDTFIASYFKKQEILSRLNADCTEMEGTAVAHVASLNKIPFLVIRCISDDGSDNAVDSFNTFIEETTIKLTILLEDFIRSLD